MDPIRRFEAGDTRQFTVTYSSAPGTTPYLAIYAGSGNSTLVSSQTAGSSSSTAFYAFFTMPGTATFYAYVWVASFTAGPVKSPEPAAGVFQVVQTQAAP